MHYRNINSLTMKEMNAQSVINAVRNSGQISRRDLAACTGLTTATITNLVGALIEEGLLLESGSGVSAGGRKPIFLEINPGAGYAIGMELNTAELICILSDFRAGILDKAFVTVDVKKGKDVIIGQIIGTIDAIIEKNGVDRKKVMGIGFVSAGPYERETGVMINPPNFPDWHYVPIRQIIEKATGINTYFEKETPAAALGEYCFGKTNGNSQILFTNVYEVGLGGGMVIGGKVFHGFMDGGMDLGHMTVEIDGYPCPCGGKGCLEVQADGEAAVRYAREMLQKGEKSLLAGLKVITLSDVTRCAAEGDAAALGAVGKCAYYLGMALSNIVNVLSPDVVYLGGPFMDSCEIFFAETVKKMEERTYPPHIREIAKLHATFGKESGAMGGLALVFQKISEV